MRKNRSVLGTFVLLAASVIWGTAFVFQRVAIRYMTSIAYGALRLSIGAIFLIIIIVIIDLIKKKLHKEIIPFNKETIFGGLILGVCIFFATTTHPD